MDDLYTRESINGIVSKAVLKTRRESPEFDWVKIYDDQNVKLSKNPFRSN